jgi:hypothetical protein
VNKDQEYFQNAQECERMARIAKSGQEQRSWLELAEAWLRMASQRSRAQASGTPIMATLKLSR